MKMMYTVSDPLLCPLVFVQGVGEMAAPFAIVGGKQASNYSKKVQPPLPGDVAVCAGQAVLETLMPVVARFRDRVREISGIFTHFTQPLKDLRLTEQEKASDVQAKAPKTEKEKRAEKLLGKVEEPPPPPEFTEEEIVFLEEKRFLHYSWMKEKTYVEDWLEAQRATTGDCELLAETTRDIT